MEFIFIFLKSGIGIRSIQYLVYKYTWFLIMIEIKEGNEMKITRH